MKACPCVPTAVVVLLLLGVSRPAWAEDTTFQAVRMSFKARRRPALSSRTRYTVPMLPEPSLRKTRCRPEIRKPSGFEPGDEIMASSLLPARDVAAERRSRASRGARAGRRGVHARSGCGGLESPPCGTMAIHVMHVARFLGQRIEKERRPERRSRG